MNRYRGPATGPSKATPSTVCQKCLKRDNYECKAVAQERPYVSRPSRTQQLLNPKLLPKLTSDVPQELLRKKGIADEQLAKVEFERERKRDRRSEDVEARGGPKRMRSLSFSSVSTISTNRSRSPPTKALKITEDVRPLSRQSMEPRGRSPSLSQSPPRRTADFERKRRRESYSSSSNDETPGSRRRGSSRSTRRRIRQRSPSMRGRRSQSTSPRRDRTDLSNDRHSTRGSLELGRGAKDQIPEKVISNTPPKERSLSPFSKRLALTQSMNMSR